MSTLQTSESVSVLEQQKQQEDEGENELNSSSNSKSLQTSFQKFRKERFEKMKYVKYLKQQKQDERRSTEFKENLRKKFVEQCKKYFGVPYHKKYWNEDEAHYNDPLFLDCCGLIRQVIFDLREEFGFSLGRWNQAYQYDICPKEVKFEEMKAGDLIFYSATYYNEKLKPFSHSMVHVEVFTGGETGEQTIGARWQKGFVQYHDSYKFVSKNYYDIKFHFRSLDTWLDGICQSCCKQHPWRDDRDLWVPDKFSVFADPELEDSAENENQKVKSVEESEIKEVFVGKGNNDALIREYFLNTPGFRILDASRAFSPKFDFKWVQTNSEIDFFSFREGEQIVNHIPNINIFTSKVGLVNLLKQYEQEEQEKKESKDSHEISSKDFFPESYQLDMMSDEIAFLNQDTDPTSIWILKPHNNNMGKGIIMIGDIIAFKREFVQTKKYKLGEYTANFLISKDGSKDKEVKKEAEKLNEPKKEIEGEKPIEPTVEDKGGEEEETIKKDTEQKQEILKYEGISHHSIIQKYIKAPLLLENRKFDIRCYGLIASTKPLLLLFNKGYARVCLQDYSLDDLENKTKRHAHLTNAAVQKSHSNYKAKKEDSIWTIEKLSEHIKDKHGFNQAQQDQMWEQIKKIIKQVVIAGYSKLEKKRGQYELLGVDILIDSNLKPYLLEVNTNPALFVDTSSQKLVIPKMMHKALDIVLSVNKTNFTNFSQESFLESVGNIHPFELIYSHLS